MFIQTPYCSQPTLSISAALLKQPQEEPVAEMMDCKKSLGLSIADNADKNPAKLQLTVELGPTFMILI